MRTTPGLLGQLVLSLLLVAACHGASPRAAQVIGVGECADCLLNNIKTSHAFSGLGVTIDCKLANGELKRRASGELDEHGKFKVTLPHETLSEDGLQLKEECYAQLHGASGIPCSNHNGIESSKIIFSSNKYLDDDHDEGKINFSPSGKLRFSSETCTSAFLWPHHKYPHLPKVWPKKPCPPLFKKPLPPPFPVYKKPLLPPVPVYKKPLPPPVPVYKKPLPPPVPVYKKPLPPPVPIYKKKPLPPFPIHKKPLPHLPKFPPIHKKPLPHLPKFPPIHEKPHPQLPKFPPIYKKPYPPIYYKKPLPHFPKFPPLHKKPCPPIIPKIKIPPN